MKINDDGTGGREERVESSLREGVRVFSNRGENEDVDNVNDSNAQVVAELFSKHRGCGDDFRRKFKPDSDKHDIRIDSVVG